MDKNNFLIVIDGIDGSGKQTQTELLLKYLKQKNKKVIMQSFPNYQSDSSKPVKLYLSGQLSKKADEINSYQSSVLFAVDRFCTLKMMYNQIQENNVILFDRYVSSNMLHQGGKIEDPIELDKYLNWLDDFEFNLMKLPRPDLIFFLDMPPDKSLELANQRKEYKGDIKNDIHEQDKNHLIHAYQTGINIAKKYQWTIISCVDDKNQIKSSDNIHKEIVEIVNQKLGLD